MIRSRNVQESCGATALSRWQSLCLKKEAFNVVRLCKPCLSLMGSRVSLGYDSLRLKVCASTLNLEQGGKSSPFLLSHMLSTLKLHP